MCSLVESLKHLLKYAELSDEAILTYSVLAGLKPRTLGEIVSLTNLTHDRAERAVRELMAKKLVREIAGRPTRYEALPPYSLIKRHIEDITGSIKKFESSLVRSVEESIIRLNEGLQRFSEGVTRSFENVVISIASSIEDTLSRIVRENIASILEDVLKRILDTAVESTSTSFMEMKDRIVDEFKESIRSAMSDFSAQISNVTSSLASEIRSLIYEKTRNQISEIISRFEVGARAIDALIVKGFEKEKEVHVQMQVMRGLERIKGQAGDMLKRAQNFVIFVAPTYDYVPKDIIQQLPTRVRIQIVAGFYPKHNDMVKELKSRGATTQLRSMRDLQIFGVVADMKEALLCAIPPTVVDPDSIIAVFTNDDAWISMIQSQLSHIFMGASRL